MRTSVKSEVLREYPDLRCRREAYGRGRAFVVRDSGGGYVSHDHFDPASAWSIARRRLCAPMTVQAS